jgi:UDP-N-acetylmuramate dehydrogenase
LTSNILPHLKTALAGIELRENEPMREHTSFKIGGAVAAMVLPRSESEFIRALAAMRGLEIAPLVIGRGTNLLVSDAPRDVYVIKTTPELSAVTVDGNALTSACGAPLSLVATAARDASLAGFEFAHGIPGTVGGAAYMNAGAYGGEIGAVATSIRALTVGGEVCELSASECDFSYRHSAFQNAELVILGATFKLKRGDRDEIAETMRDYAERRRSSQPLDLPSAGSAFKRPETGVYAAKLIDESGLRGFRVGGAAVSEKHTGFVVNLGGATYDDVRRVLDHVRDTVYKHTGVQLVPEIKIIE